jgi:hypothetical protein
MATHKSASAIEVIPSAKRLILSLRDVGYDLAHAVADLVDNSIAADATRVDIQLHFGGSGSWIRIADNGRGMSGSTITEAMRYGSDRKYEADDLGKFGLGLKTASMSQCRRLSVASRTDPHSRRIEVRVLDLDYIEKRNKWEVLSIGPKERGEHLVAPLENQVGTVVLWEQLDRVLNYKVVWGERAKMRLFNEADRLEQHLAMVFHRFLSGDARRRRKLQITVNGNKVEPWDPFVRHEPTTESMERKEFEVNTSSGKGIVSYQPFVLPPREKFSSDAAFEKAGGPLRWNRQQGFYIYRADRLIQSGGWCRMRTADEHTKLARAALDFYPDLDNAFEVNVSKVRVSLPSELRDQLQYDIEFLVKRARNVYDHKTGGAGPSGRRISGGVGLKAGRGNARSGGPDNNLGDGRLRSALEEAARRVDEEKALDRIVRELSKGWPEESHALGW